MVPHADRLTVYLQSKHLYGLSVTYQELSHTNTGYYRLISGLNEKQASEKSYLVEFIRPDIN